MSTPPPPPTDEALTDCANGCVSLSCHMKQPQKEMKQYYICKPDHTQEGPYPEEMVRTSYEQGIFPANTLIWFDGAPEWMPIQNIFTELRTAASTPSVSDTSVSVAEPDKAAVSAILTPQPAKPAAPADIEATPYPVPPAYPLQEEEEATYYIALPGMQPQGPYTRTSVITGYNQGDYPHGSKVWGSDTGNWVPISHLVQAAAPHNPMENAVPMQLQSGLTPKSWNPITAFVSCMKRYVQFSGRASRKEYFFFHLACLILLLVLCFILAPALSILGRFGSVVSVLLFHIIYYGSLIPSIAVTARRFHDTGRSGWMMLIPVYSCVIVFLPSKNDNNPYGSAPLPPA